MQLLMQQEESGKLPNLLPKLVNPRPFTFTWSSVFALCLGHTVMNLLNAASNYRFKKFIGLASQKIIMLNKYNVHFTSGGQVNANRL